MSATTRIHDRLWRLLDGWCRWLGGYVTELGPEAGASLTPLSREGKPQGYDAVAGDQFAASAAGFWLARVKDPGEAEVPLRELIRLALGSHISTQSLPLEPGRLWGATVNHANNWHASLFPPAAATMMIDALNPAERAQLETILTWEAAFHANRPVGMVFIPWSHDRKTPGRMPWQAVGESLAWTAASLQAARLVCPAPASHASASWREAAISHALNTLSFPEDLESTKHIAGRPLRDWVVGANFEPGGIQEHHHFYHPGYMAWPLASHALCHLIDQKLDVSQRDVDVYLHHWQYVYDRLKTSCFDNGRMIFPAGFDWNQYGYGNTRNLTVSLFAALVFEDQLAMRIVDQWLSLMEKQQQHTGGPIQGSRLQTLVRRDPGQYSWYEAIDGLTLAECLWMLEQLPEAKCPPPCDDQTFNDHGVETYVEPNARLAWHRSENAWSSMSWRAAPQGSHMTVLSLHEPHARKFNTPATGVVEADGVDHELLLQWYAQDHLPRGGFWSIGQVNRGRCATQRNASPVFEQYLGMITLKDGPTLWLDMVRALRDVTVTANLCGHMRLAADFFNDHQALLIINGRARHFTPAKDEDVWHDLGASPIGVGRDLVVVAQGSGGFHLKQHRARDPQGDAMLYQPDPVGAEESLLAHDLYFGRREAKTYQAGQWVRRHLLTFHHRAAGDLPRVTVQHEDHDPRIGTVLVEGKTPLLFNFTALGHALPGGHAAPRSVRPTDGTEVKYAEIPG